MNRRGIGVVGAGAFLVLTVAVGWAAGLFSRLPFDDEIHTQRALESGSFVDIALAGLTGGDIHPPLSMLLFKALSGLGLSPPALRVVSFVLAALAFVAILDLVCWCLDGADRARRLIAFALFAGCPLLFGAGDSLRWYPLFAVLVAGFVRTVFVGGHASPMAGLLLGLAALTNYIAVVPALAYLAYRMAWRLRWRWRSDGWFLAALALPGGFAVFGFAAVARAGGAMADAGPLGALAGTALGYLGGGRLGLSLLPVALPAALLTGLALLAVVRRRVWRDVGDGAGALAVATLAMVVASAAIVAATGMAKPRTFLFLAPFLCALTVLYGPLTSPRWRSVGTLLAVAPTLLLLTQLRATEWPFKRNHAVPFDKVVEWIAPNAPPGSMVYASEPVLVWLLEKKGLCVADRYQPEPFCARSMRRRPATVLLVRDHVFDADPALGDVAARAIVGRSRADAATFGTDRDAAWKRKLTSVDLPDWIVRVEVWR